MPTHLNGFQSCPNTSILRSDREPGQLTGKPGGAAAGMGPQVSLLSACCALNYLLGMCSCLCTRCHLVGQARHGHSFLSFFFCRCLCRFLWPLSHSVSGTQLLSSFLGLRVSGKLRQSVCIFYELSNDARKTCEHHLLIAGHTPYTTHRAGDSSKIDLGCFYFF